VASHAVPPPVLTGRTQAGRSNQSHGRFGAVQALPEVSLLRRTGEAQALMGENVAGKPTPIRILATLDRPDVGRDALGGVALPSGNPAACARRG
jgi:ABC-type sugar transport system ATPase subunit